MNNSRNQKGNLLTSALGLLVLVVVILIGIVIATYPNLSIDNSRSNKLNTMIEDVKGTSFQSLFNSKVNHLMQDGKVTNTEFLELEELYKGYKTSKLTNNDQQYISKIQAADTQTENENNKSIVADNKLGLLFAMFVGFVVLIIFMYKTIRGQRP